MLKVVLVDDDEIVLEGIREGIDWASHGYEVVGEAQDGEQALEVVERTRPDIVISDIRMPFMDGLTFIERMKETYPNTFIVIISGHEAFQYAQRALQLGASEYLLKPIDIDGLLEALAKIRGLASQRDGKERELGRLKELVAETSELLREKTLAQYLHGKTTAESFAEQFPRFCRERRFMVVECQVYGNPGEAPVESGATSVVLGETSVVRDATPVDRGEARHADGTERAAYDEVRLRIEAGRRPEWLLLENESGSYTLCLAGPTDMRLNEELRAFLSAARASIAERGDLTLTAGISRPHGSVRELPEAYREACEALSYKYIAGIGRDLRYEEMNKLSAETKRGVEAWNDSELLTAVQIGDKALIQERVERLVAAIQAQGSDSYLYTQLTIGSLYMEVIKRLKEFGGSVDDVFEDPVQTYKTMIGQQTIQALAGELTRALYAVADYMQAKRNGRFDQLVRGAQTYIGQHYSDEHLSLETVAQFVNMSPSYFSAVFKQHTGETFVDYVTRIRVERARQLLGNSEFRTYEVSYMVGYSNPTYFSTLFKKVTGLTPSQYRMALSSKNETKRVRN